MRGERGDASLSMLVLGGWGCLEGAVFVGERHQPLAYRGTSLMINCLEEAVSYERGRCRCWCDRLKVGLGGVPRE